MPNCYWSSFLICNVDFTRVAKRLAGSFNIVQREMTAEGLRSRGAEGNPDRLPPQLLCSPAFLLLCRISPPQIVSGAKPRTPKGSSRTAQGASPGFKVQIAESPERAAQGFGLQLNKCWS